MLRFLLQDLSAYLQNKLAQCEHNMYIYGCNMVFSAFAAYFFLMIKDLTRNRENARRLGLIPGFRSDTFSAGSTGWSRE